MSEIKTSLLEREVKDVKSDIKDVKSSVEDIVKDTTKLNKIVFQSIGSAKTLAISGSIFAFLIMALIAIFSIYVEQQSNSPSPRIMQKDISSLYDITDSNSKSLASIESKINILFDKEINKKGDKNVR